LIGLGALPNSLSLHRQRATLTTYHRASCIAPMVNIDQFEKLCREGEGVCRRSAKQQIKCRKFSGGKPDPERRG
jgi:hypothetical protein